MHVTLTDDVTRFAETASGFLRQERFSASVVAVEVAGILAGERLVRPGSLWILVEDGGRTVGAAMHTPPYHVFLPRLPDGVAEAIATELRVVGRELPGVSGERAAVGAFLESWSDGREPRFELVRSMRMYVLGWLRPPRGVDGAARVALDGDADLVGSWLQAFHEEAHPDAPTETPAVAAQRIATGSLHLWEHDGARVSLAGVSAPAAGVARVGPVYTPPEHRRRGFGAAVTAAVASVAIAAGAEDVVLYTDLSNPTSNSIYQSIGFRPDHDAEQYGLVAR